MNYYVISPNVWNNGENYSEEMRKKQIAAVGWTEENLFRKMSTMLIQRIDWSLSIQRYVD